MPSKKEDNGCGCSSIPVSLIIVLLGLGYWGFTQFDGFKISQFLPMIQQPAPATQPTPIPSPTTSPRVAVASSPLPPLLPSGIPSKPQIPSPASSLKVSVAQTLWEKKAIRGIYLSRYQATNNADEKTIRERVRYYRNQGINTIIHGVWGNGCTMYKSDVMQQTLGYKSCPNQFRDQWLDWLIDEAHKQGMQVHAYFEKGIKIDQNSPIFDLAISKRWLVPGVDKTYASIDQYVLDVEMPAVANFFKQIAVEFVQKYPTVDAVQWDDYLAITPTYPEKSIALPV